jgi:hypothetical protein
MKINSRAMLGDGTCGYAERPARSSRMRYLPISLLLLVTVLAGCTNLRPVAMDTNTLQGKIRDGTAVNEGETVRVVTRDGVSHLLVVTAVEGNTLRGDAHGARPGAIVIEIPVDDILLLEKEKVNAVDTAVSSVGVAAIVLGAGVIIAPFAVLGALGLL